MSWNAPINVLFFNLIAIGLGAMFLLTWFQDLKRGWFRSRGRMSRFVKSRQGRGAALFLLVLGLPPLLVNCLPELIDIKSYVSYSTAMLTASVTVALLISLGWASYLRAIDVFEREGIGWMLLMFVLGCLSVLFVWPIGDTLFDLTEWSINGHWWNDWWYCVIRIGLLEEVVKLLPFLILMAFSKQVNEPVDYIIYASLSALGFAFIENIQYLNSSQLDAVFGRALFSSIAHMFNSSVVAYAIVLARHRKYWWRWISIPIGLVFASFSHGFYDFWLISVSVAKYQLVTWFFLLATLQLWVVMKNNLLNISPFYHANVKLRPKRFKYLVINTMVIALSVAYLLKYLLFGKDAANDLFVSAYVRYTYILLFVSISISNMEVIPGYVKSLPWFPNIVSLLIPRIGGSTNLSQSKVRLYLPETSERPKQVRTWVPLRDSVTGTLKRRLVMNGFTSWYIVTFDDPLAVATAGPFMIRAADVSEALNNRKPVLAHMRTINDLSDEEDGVILPENTRLLGGVMCERVPERSSSNLPA